MKIYIDDDYKCHISNPDGKLKEYDEHFFDNKCQDFIEGHRYIPSDEKWTREDGVEFRGPMISPWKDSDKLDAAQRQYEQAQLADMRQALAVLGVTLDE